MPHRILRALLIALLLAAGMLCRALAELPLVVLEEAVQISVGEWLSLDLNKGAHEFSFTAPAEDEYALCAFPISEDAQVRAELYRDTALLASGNGSMALASVHLIEGETVQVSLTGAGQAAFEISRSAKSRCCELPINLHDNGGYTKQIVHAGDDHWFFVRAESGGAALLSLSSEDRLDLELRMFTARGQLIAEGIPLPSGAQVLSAVFQAGETYLIRISAMDGGIGRARLQLQRSANTKAPDSIQVTTPEMVITGRSTDRVPVVIEPEDACPLVYVDSDDRAVVNADDKTSIEGREAGTALVTVTAYGGAQSNCQVTVERVSVQRISFPWDQITMAVGDELAVSASIEPVNATDRAIAYTSADQDIVRAAEDGTLTALATGMAEIFATSQDRGLIARLSVNVQPAPTRCRALLIGEQNYMISVDAAREGSVRSVEGIMSMLKNGTVNGVEVGVTALMDAPRDSVIAAIRRVLGDARDDDISILYLTCHGFYRAGMTHFLMADGSVLSAADLARELAGISGTMIVLADCCASGGLIGEASDPSDLTEGLMSAFRGARGAAVLSGPRIHVLCSASLDQDSYRLGSDSDMATAFGRALCEAAGWDLDNGTPSTPMADRDSDGVLSMDETAAYLKKRVSQLLNETAGGYSQTVCMYPEHDGMEWYREGKKN